MAEGAHLRPTVRSCTTLTHADNYAQKNTIVCSSLNSISHALLLDYRVLPLSNTISVVKQILAEKKYRYYYLGSGFNCQVALDSRLASLRIYSTISSFTLVSAVTVIRSLVELLSFITTRLFSTLPLRLVISSSLSQCFFEAVKQYSVSQRQIVLLRAVVKHIVSCSHWDKVHFLNT